MTTNHADAFFKDLEARIQAQSMTTMAMPRPQCIPLVIATPVTRTATVHDLAAYRATRRS